jgi:hypothetical protein
LGTTAASAWACKPRRFGCIIGSWLSKLHADFEPDVVAFECLLRADLRRSFQFGRETGFAELRGMEYHNKQWEAGNPAHPEHEYEDCRNPRCMANRAAEERCC